MGAICSTPTDNQTAEKVTIDEPPNQMKEEDAKADEAPPTTEEPAAAADGPKYTINVFGCRGLRNADWTWVPGVAGGLSDAYVICTESTAAKESKELLKTKAIQNSLEPLFNEEFEVQFATDSVLEFTVYDKDPIKADDVLGHVKLECSELTKGFNGELALEDAGKGIKAYIKLMIKADGGEYPKGPDTEFKIAFEKTASQALGFEFDKITDDVIFVTSVATSGAVKDYNDTKGPDEQMKSGQYITAVNSVTDSSKSMAEELAKGTKFELTMVRPYVFSIAITKTGTLGLSVAQGVSSNVITKVQPGPVEDWNKQHTDKEVKPGDRIVAVNGNRAQGKDQMTLLRPDGAMQLVLSRRSPPADASGIIKCLWDWF